MLLSSSLPPSVLFWILYVVAFITTPLVFHLISTQMEGQMKAHVRRAGFLVTIQFFMILWSFVIWKRFTSLISSSCSSKFLADASRASLMFLIVAVHSVHVWFYCMVGREPHWVAIISTVSYALAAQLAAFLIGFITLTFLVGLLANTALGGRLVRQLSRVFLVKALLFNTNFQTLFSLLLSLAFTCHGLYATRGVPLVNTVPIQLKRLHPAFDGLRVVHLTDLHIGPTVGYSRTKLVVDEVKKLNPDLITIAGDLVDGYENDLLEAVSPLKELKARLGIYFSTGNHEYYHGNIDGWFKYFRASGITVLHNQHVKITPQAAVNASSVTGPQFCMAGVDDASAESSGVSGHAMDPDAALIGCDTKQNAVVMLCHQPRGAKRILARRDDVDLILAGHTHGGQIWILIPMCILTNPFFAGLYKLVSGAQVFVSTGVHFWGPPVKNTGLEISLLILKSLQKSP